MAKIDWKDADGKVASVTRGDGRDLPSYIVVFTYEVDGHWCGGTFTTFEEYRKGDSVAVRYDPKNPDYNDLTQEESRTNWIVAAMVTAVALLSLWAWVALH
ncbi:MAG TPA: DUF3592 domain-containing protein [Acidobacteriaceae bacterium]